MVQVSVGTCFSLEILDTLPGKKTSLRMPLSTPKDIVEQATNAPATQVVQAPLPGWMLSIPGVARIVDRLGVIEFRRRLLHMAPAFIPIGLPFIPHNAVWAPMLIATAVIIVAVGLFLAVIFGRKVTRPGESSFAVAVLGYTVPIIGGLLLFPGHAELGLMTLQIVALGDGSATLGGILIGGKHLPWNSHKTFSGLLCFIAVGSVAATYSYWGEATPTVPVGTVFLICSGATFFAALIESLPVHSNDNLRVGVSALFAGTVLSSLLR